MKVAFDGRVLKHKVYSGVENYTVNILNELQHKEEVRLLKPNVLNKYLQQIWEHTKLPFLLSKNELLFCPANIAPLWVSPKNKLVITLHDVAFKTFPTSISKLFYLYYSWIVPRNIKRANHIITISEASKNEILKYYPEATGKITIIHNGIDKKYQALPYEKKEKQILYVGSINERKNVVGLIKAFQLISHDIEYSLVIVGNFFGNFTLNSETRSILEKAKKDPNIKFLHGLEKEELLHQYQISSCFVFPSFYEGFGLPPLEAMACGTPVITSNISSMPEVCGDAALYVDPYSVEDISEKIQLLLSDTSLQKEYIAKGLAHVKTYTWESAAKAHLKIFKEMLDI